MKILIVLTQQNPFVQESLEINPQENLDCYDCKEFLAPYSLFNEYEVDVTLVFPKRIQPIIDYNYNYLESSNLHSFIDYESFKKVSKFFRVKNIITKEFDAVFFLLYLN